MRYRLQNRYQDEGWRDMDRPFCDIQRAIDAAGRLSRNAICYGMVRVVDQETGNVITTFSAGGGRLDNPAPQREYGESAKVSRPSQFDAHVDHDDVGPPKYPPGLRGVLMRIADLL